MKRLLILGSLLLSAGFASAQTVSEKPFKGANVILIQSSDSINKILEGVGAQLVSRGFTVKSFDKTFHTLVTEPKQIKGGAIPVAVIVRAAKADLGAQLTADASLDITSFTAGAAPNIERLAIRGTTPKGPIVEIIEAAKAYPGGSVLYSKKD